MNKFAGMLCLFATIINIVNEDMPSAFITGVLSILNFLIDYK